MTPQPSENIHREYGIDILRILAMLLIVMHHILTHGRMYESAAEIGGG